MILKIILNVFVLHETCMFQRLRVGLKSLSFDQMFRGLINSELRVKITGSLKIVGGIPIFSGVKFVIKILKCGKISEQYAAVLIFEL